MISVVIPHFDDTRLLGEHLPKMLKLIGKRGELIVVDDHSPESVQGNLKKLQTQYPEVIFIFKDKNEGFASTVHEGMKQAREEVVFVLKNDSLPASGEFFEVMGKHFKNNQVFGVSSGLLSVEKGKKEVRGCGVIYYEKGFFLHKRGNNESKISAWADGGASAFKKELYFQIGGFDPIFNPFYWEDVDLGYRAWKAGYEIHFEPGATLEHKQQLGTISRHFSEKEKNLVSLRNQFSFLWCNADTKYLMRYFFWLPYHYAVAIKNRDGDFVRAHLLSLGQIGKLMRARWERKRLQKRSDDEVLGRFKEI